MDTVTRRGMGRNSGSPWTPGHRALRAGQPPRLRPGECGLPRRAACGADRLRPAKPTTRVYDIANALWYWAPLRDPRDRSPELADADIPHRVAVFADAYGMTAQQRAGLMPLAVDMVRRYHEDSRASAGLDPVWRKLWEGSDGLAGTPAKIYLPRAEAWVREMAPVITARLVQSS